MKIAYQWIRDYVKTTTAAEELGEKFQMTSSVLEAVEDWQRRLAGIVVGKVVTNSEHPKSQKLRILQVSLGKKTEQILTAGVAPAGSLVAVALPGATLHPLKGEPWQITIREMGGEVSNGMLCGLEEMGVNLKAKDWEFIPDGTPAGTAISDILFLNDKVLDLEVTPNRPDLLSYFGLAREVSTFEKKTLLEPPIYRLDEEEIHEEIPFKVKVENSHLVPRYSAIVLHSIEIKPSPRWLQSRLLLSGIRPINTVVDVTNYVMLELGQPLHAFDLSSLGTEGLMIGSAKNGEKLTTLDGVERTLSEGDIIISDSTRPIDLAGVMGGLESGINDTTTAILLEAANFDGASIRRTTRRLGLRTEASSRFEKGLDPELTVTALKRAIFLLQQISHAKVGSRILDIYPKARSERPRIHNNFTRIQQVLGVNISAAETKSILQKLGFQIPLLTKSSFEVIPPSWRHDIELPEDVIEELVRIWGYDRVPLTLPVGAVKAPFPLASYAAKARLRQRLASLGMHETIHLSFASSADLGRLNYPISNCIKLPNPLSQEVAFLLPTHIISFLNNLSTVNRENEECALFEISHLFNAPDKEIPTLTLLWRTQVSYEATYQKAKQTIFEIADCLSLPKPTMHSYTVSQKNSNHYISDSFLDISLDGKMIGTLGSVKPSVVEKFKIRRARTIVAVELSLDALLTVRSQNVVYSPILQHPSIERDISLICPSDLKVKSLTDCLEPNLNSDITLSFAITDIFSGKPLEKDQKAVTIHFIYNAKNRTLEDTEVNHDQERITTLLTNQLPIHIN